MNIFYCCCLVLSVCLSTSLYAQNQADTISFREELLFGIDCNVSDVRKQARPTPCLAIAHDTLIVFPTHQDTITFFCFDGTIVRKIHNKLNFFPTHIHYSDEEELIYLMSVGTWSDVLDTTIYGINLKGEVEKKYGLVNGNIDIWFARTQQLTKKEIQILKKHFRVREPISYYAGTGVTKNILYDFSAIINERYVFMDRYTGYSFIKNSNKPDEDNLGYNIEYEYYYAYDFATSSPVILKTITADIIYRSIQVSPNCEDIEWYVTKKTISPGRCGNKREKSYIQVAEGRRSFAFTRLIMEE
jgi:hypothetical protein